MANVIELSDYRGAKGTQNDRLPGAPWGQSLLAGLPHLLVGLVSTLSGILVALGLIAPDSLLASGLTLALVLAFVATGLGLLALAWRQGWPRWAASWYTYWALGVLGLALISVQFIALGRTASFTSIFSLLPVFLLAAYILYRLSRSDPLRALLAALPIVLMLWMTLLEFVPNLIRSATQMFAWLLAALTATLIVRRGRPDLALILALLFSLLAGLPYAYDGIFLGGALPFSAPGPSAAEVTKVWLPYWLATSTLLVGPWLGRAHRLLGLRAGRFGGVFYRLALLSLLLVILSVLGSFALATSDQLFTQNPTWLDWIRLGAYGALLVYLMAYGLLLLAAMRSDAHLPLPLTAGLLLASLGLPLALIFGAFNGFRYLPPGLPLGLSNTLEISIWLEIGAGILWLLLSAWTLIRIEQEIKKA